MFENILIGTDTVQGLEIALDRAVEIALTTQARVRVAEVIWDHFAEEPSNIISPEDKEKLIARFLQAEQKILDRTLQPYRDRLGNLDGRVLWAKRVEDQIAIEAATSKADLVIKPVVEESHGIADWFFTPLDWRLMRAIDVPVLFAQSSYWPKHRCVLAAIDVGRRHREVTALILERAAEFARLFDCTLHAVNTFGPIASHGTAEAHASLRREGTEKRTSLLTEVTQGLDVPVELHVLEGRPGPTIQGLVEKIDPALTVVGTRARRGLGKLFIGNTAEEIIRHLSCDLVTINVS